MARSIQAPMRGVPLTIQNAASADEAPGIVVTPPDSFKNHTFYIKGSAGVASGAIQVESADDPAYAGVWAAQGGGPVTVVVSAEVTVTLSGVFKALRARIETVIGGGTVTVVYVGS